MKRILLIIVACILFFPMIVKANIVCNDGTVSSSCADCHKGCCSRHGGCTDNPNSGSGTGSNNNSYAYYRSNSNSSSNDTSNNSSSSANNSAEIVSASKGESNSLVDNNSKDSFSFFDGLIFFVTGAFVASKFKKKVK